MRKVRTKKRKENNFFCKKCRSTEGKLSGEEIGPYRSLNVYTAKVKCRANLLQVAEWGVGGIGDMFRQRQRPQKWQVDHVVLLSDADS